MFDDFDAQVQAEERNSREEFMEDMAQYYQSDVHKDHQNYDQPGWEDHFGDCSDC